jgi:hypothetical protein
VRRVEHRIARVGQVRLGPQRSQVRLEVQRGAAGEACLQGIAGERIAQAGLVQREKVRPVLPARQFAQKIAAQVGGGNPVRVVRQVLLHRGAVDLLDVVLQRRRLQIRVQRVIAQTTRQRLPGGSALLRSDVDLAERGALGGIGFGGARDGGGYQQPGSGQHQPAQRDAPRWMGSKHGHSCDRSIDQCSRWLAAACCEIVARAGC